MWSRGTALRCPPALSLTRHQLLYRKKLCRLLRAPQECQLVTLTPSNPSPNPITLTRSFRW